MTNRISNISLILAVFWCYGSAFSQNTYYVAPEGGDANAGTVEAPFPSIAHAMGVLQPGDTCILRAGVYHEVIRPGVSGTKEAPITIRAAEGESVVVNGADPVGGWTTGEGGVWSASLEGAAEQVFVAGVPQPEACWPNTPNDPMQRVWAEADEGSTAAAILDAEMPALDVNGATAHVLPGAHWVSWTLAVKSIDPAAHTVGIETTWEQSEPYAVRAGTRYYLFGARGLLDAPGEWWADTANKLLFFMPPGGADPNTLAVQVKQRTHGIDLHEMAFVNVIGVKVLGAAISLDNANNCKVAHCHVRYASHLRGVSGWTKYNDTGIVISGSGNTLQHSSVFYSAGNGITLLGTGNSVEDNLVRYANYMATDCAAVWAEGEGHVIRQNTLSHTGRSVLIHRYLKSSKIVMNNMSYAGLMCGDLGTTYCYATDGAGTEIGYNWAHDNQASSTAVGIYIDNGSSNFILHHNVCWGNKDSGIRLNTPSHNVEVFHNTVVDNGNSLGYWGSEGNKDWTGCRIINNIFTDDVSVGDGAVFESNWRAPRPGLMDQENRDLRLKDGSNCIDAGVIIEGFPVEFVSSAPDLGAFEFNAPPWMAGHTWGDAPVF